MPDHIKRADIPATPLGPAFAIDTMQLGPVAAPDTGMLLVSGPAGSGRTTAVLALLEAFASQPDRPPLDTVLLAPRRSALREAFAWGTVADEPGTRADTIEWLTVALGGKRAQPMGLPLLPLIGTTPEATPEPTDATKEQQQASFPAAGMRGLVIVEDIGGFDGSGSEHALAVLLKLLRSSDLTTIVEGENATLTTVWELATPLRGLRWALALQPDANDVSSIFTTPFLHAKRADYPPGRGLLVRNGSLTGVQVGIPANR